MTFNNNNTINKLEIWKTFKRIILRYNLYHHNTVARSSNLADMKKYPLRLRSLFQSSACHHTSSTTNRTTGCDSTTIQNWERWNILTFIKNVLLARSSNLADMKKYPLRLRSLFQSSACHHTSSTTNRTTGCDSTTIQNWERWNILTFIKNVLLAALCKCRS